MRKGLTIIIQPHNGKTHQYENIRENWTRRNLDEVKIDEKERNAPVRHNYSSRSDQPT